MSPVSPVFHIEESMRLPYQLKTIKVKPFNSVLSLIWETRLRTRIKGTKPTLSILKMESRIRHPRGPAN